MNPEQMIPSYFGGYGPPARFRQRNNPVDAIKYDFRAHRTNLPHPNSVPDSIIHLSMSGLGLGVVSIHTAYSECGIWTALGLNIVLAPLIGYCICTLVWSAQKLYGRAQVAKLSYPDTVEACILLSPWPKFRKCATCFRYVLEGCLVLQLYGCCCTCIIMIARNLKELVEGDDYTTDSGEPPLGVYILCLMGPCIIISMLKNLKYLAPFVLVCSVTSVSVIITTLWYGLRVDHSPLEAPAYKGPIGIYQFTCVFAFMLETGSYALDVENNMDTPKKFHYVEIGTVSIISVSLMIVGFVGYWRYGEGCISPLTVYYPYQPYPTMVKILVCLIHYLIYATSFSRGFDVEWFYLRTNAYSNHWFWEIVYRSLHVLGLTIAAYYLPFVTRMMGIVGSCCAVPITFVFPPLIQLIVDWEYPGLGRWKWRLLRYIALVLFGVSTCFAGIYYNMYATYLRQVDTSEPVLRKMK